MENEKKPKKKRRLSEAGVIIIGALVGLIPSVILALGLIGIIRLFFSIGGLF